MGRRINDDQGKSDKPLLGLMAERAKGLQKSLPQKDVEMQGMDSATEAHIYAHHKQSAG